MPSSRGSDKLDALRREFDDKIAELRHELDRKLGEVFESRNKDVKERHVSDMQVASKLVAQEKDIANILGLIKQLQELADSIATIAAKTTEIEKKGSDTWKYLKWGLWAFGILVTVLLAQGIIDVRDILDAIKTSNP